MLRVLNGMDSILGHIEKILLFLFCLALTGIMITQVILRYFFGSPIFWAEEVSVQFLIFITVFGVSYLTKIQQHISIDIILTQLGPAASKALKIILGLFFLILMLFICFYAWEWVLRPDVQAEKSGTTGLPRWYTYISLPLALSFLCWHQFVVLLNYFFAKNTELLP